MTGAGGAVYSPGYQLTLWLGSGQLRLWRRLDRMLGSSSEGSSTIRAIARSTGANPGAVSRDLGRLAALGFVVRSTTRGRFGGVRLWRVVSRRARELAGRARALRRMRAPAPGQLELILAAGTLLEAPWWDPEPVELDEPEPVGPEPGSLRAERDPAPDITDRIGSEYGEVRCERCGRLRLTYHGSTAGPCPYDRP